MNISRKDARIGIRRGQAAVNSETVKNPEFSVDPERDSVLYNGQAVCYKQYIYIVMNKPAGVLSASADKSRETVVDLVPEKLQRRGLFPVGRLDRDTEGLLLITNDGELAHRLLSPKNHVDKVYFARLDAPVGETERRQFAEGLRVDETLTAMPAQLDILGPGNEVKVTIREGKFHQIKRMFAAVGREVVYLKRLSMGPLVLDGSLPPGAYRRLTEEEESAIISL